MNNIKNGKICSDCKKWNENCNKKFTGLCGELNEINKINEYHEITSLKAVKKKDNSLITYLNEKYERLKEFNKRITKNLSVTICAFLSLFLLGGLCLGVALFCIRQVLTPILSIFTVCGACCTIVNVSKF